VNAIALLDRVHHHDVGMRQRRHRLGLAPEALQSAGVIGQLRRQYLDRDVAIQARVARPIDLSHAAGAEQLLDLVVGETVACLHGEGTVAKEVGTA